MRKAFFLWLGLVLTVGAEQARVQPTNQAARPVFSRPQASSNLLYNRIVVFRRNDNALAGFFVGAKNDTLVLLVAGRTEKVPLKNLTKVEIAVEKNASRFGAYGMLLGIYFGNYLFYRAENQPSVYLNSADYENKEIIALVNLFFASVGGSAGYLVGLGSSQSEKVFDFTGAVQEQNAAWQRLQKFSLREPAPKKVHVSIQAARVYTRTQNQYAALFQNAGYSIDRYVYFFDDVVTEPAGDFNLLRKLQLTVSAAARIECGAAVLWLGEPAINGQGPEGVVRQSLHARGLYAIGVYKPFAAPRSQRIAWNVGAGVGGADIDFKLRTNAIYRFPRLNTEHSISKTSFSGVVFTELHFYLAGGLSLGLAADYVHVPQERAPAAPEARIPAKNLRLGNGSIGLMMGLHF